MSRLTLVHYRSGISLQCSNDCVCQNGVWLQPCTDPICETHPGGYLKGIKPPNYPVPAMPIEVEYDISPTPFYVATWRNDDCTRCWYKRL